MAPETLIVERDGGIVTVTLNRPEKKNAANAQMWDELRDTFEAIALNNAGFDTVNLAGGMRAWAAAGQPVVTDDGSPGSVI